MTDSMRFEEYTSSSEDLEDPIYNQSPASRPGQKIRVILGSVTVGLGLVLLVAGLIGYFRARAAAHFDTTADGTYLAYDLDTPYGNYWSTGSNKIMTVYHQTSPEICQSVMANNFHLGSGGLCGKAIYFATSPQATAGKAITPYSHGGCMIEAQVDVGKQQRYFFNGGPRHGSTACRESFTAERVHKTGVDSVILSQYDGDEIVIYEPERIIAKKILPFKCQWMCRGKCQKHWPSNCGHR